MPAPASTSTTATISEARSPNLALSPLVVPSACLHGHQVSQRWVQAAIRSQLDGQPLVRYCGSLLYCPAGAAARNGRSCDRNMRMAKLCNWRPSGVKMTSQGADSRQGSACVVYASEYARGGCRSAEHPDPQP